MPATSGSPIRYPISAASYKAQVWFLLQPKNSDPDWRRLSSLAYLRTNGPSGLFSRTTPRLRRDLGGRGRRHRPRRADHLPWRPPPRPTPAEVGWPGNVVDGDRTEKTLRAFHREWARFMDEAAS